MCAQTLDNSRAFRNTFARNGAPPARRSVIAPGNTAKLAAGRYGPHVTVNSDGSILIAASAYPDDIYAFTLGCTVSNPTVSNTIKQAQGRVIDLYDERALERHGYSDSALEAEFVWQSVAESFSPTS